MAYRAFDELSLEGVIEEDDRYIFSVEDARESWFMNYVLSYGDKAELLSPEKSRKEISAIIQNMENIYKEKR